MKVEAEFTTYELAEDLVFDVRRAAWLPDEGALIVADLHLGYAWVQRRRGQLLPLTPTNDAVDRLLALQHEYRPREIIVLGDIVHQAVPIPALQTGLETLVNNLSAGGSALTLVTGNHDRHLESLLAEWNLDVRVTTETRLGSYCLLHGDQERAQARTPGERIVMGHEHPAILIGDGAMSAVKCPCFLVSEQVIVLPAFSSWAAGTVIGRQPFLSSLAREARFTRAVAVMGDKLLPLPLPH